MTRLKLSVTNCARSSAGQSVGLRSRMSQVRFLSSAPTLSQVAKGLQLLYYFVTFLKKLIFRANIVHFIGDLIWQVYKKQSIRRGFLTAYILDSEGKPTNIKLFNELNRDILQNLMLLLWNVNYQYRMNTRRLKLNSVCLSIIY